MNECCESWLSLSNDQRRIQFDFNNPNITLGGHLVRINLTDGRDSSEYDLELNIIPMEVPYFSDWESYQEIEMAQSDINVVF